MTSAEPARPTTVLTAWTGALLRTLDDRGIDSRALAHACGVTSDMLGDPDRRIPLELSTALWAAAVDASGDDAIGIEASRHVRPGSFQALGHAFMTSSTLRGAIERAARYAQMTTDHAQGVTRLERNELVFQVIFRDDGIRPANEALDAVLATIVRSARYLLGRNTDPTRVELERPPALNAERFHTFFRCPVTFSAPATLVAFDRSTTDRPIPGGNERIAAVSERQLDDHLARHPPASVGEQVHRVLLVALEHGAPLGIDQVASDLSMSVRSLQRQLNREGTSFRDVLAGTRRTLADRLLASNVTVTEIGHRLGFSETAAFTRAYRAWTGTTPTEHRSGLAHPDA